MSKKTTSEESLITGRAKPPADLSIYKAINPRWNSTLADARRMAAALGRLGFGAVSIVCHPQGDGKGWGWVQEVSEAEMVAAGVGLNDPAHLLFGLNDSQERYNVAAVAEAFESDGLLSGFQRFYQEVHYNAPLGAWLGAVLQIPGVKDAVEAALQARLNSDAPPLTAPR
jgi:hypothetical protein